MYLVLCTINDESKKNIFESVLTIENGVHSVLWLTVKDGLDKKIKKTIIGGSISGLYENKYKQTCFITLEDKAYKEIYIKMQKLGLEDYIDSYTKLPILEDCKSISLA
ncbi:hypothetical protein SH1V18_22440 [Vallitalea longa]|uniref:Uncharacterized protein n=1 Tax=Vallitalea longa TaxID=2936439 RepID=A0A9W6DGH7_9FIRM|nr:hypothetical protein [Vallitalea longa]GKX29764.1 hypothetical protein SH1V18_22440 [Vallitalea longa]